MTKKLKTGKAAEKAYKMRLEWAPVAVLVVLFVLGGTLFIVGFSVFSPTILGFGSLLIAVLSWLIYFWLILYMVVEFQLWRRTRNIGHRLQFLGTLLLVMVPLYIWIPLLFGGWSALFTPFAAISGIVAFASFIGGLAIAVYGYYYRGFRASDIDLYRNVVVREGERIKEVTGGYSTRVFSVHYDDLSQKEVKAVADSWATTIGKTGLILDHKMDESGVIVYPVTYTGVGRFQILTVLTHLFWITRKPERLTWVRIKWNGEVGVHISAYDYDRISRPVSYHLLCAAVADAMVTSLLAFSKSNVTAATTALLGQRDADKAQAVRLPMKADDRIGAAIAVLAALLILAGLSSSIVAVALSPDRSSLAITDVDWLPENPKQGDNIEVYGTLRGADEFSVIIDYFYVVFFVYFNDSYSAALDMSKVGGDDYRARLGAFSNGTELMFFLKASIHSAGLFGSQETVLVSEPQVLRVGQVHGNEDSGISIEGVTHEMDVDGNITFSAWINSSASIETAQLYIAHFSTYNEGAGYSSEFGAFWLNLTKLGDQYRVELPPLLLSEGKSQFSATLYFKIVGRDTIWNTTTTELDKIEARG
jgi:hypothetical protein